MIARHCEYRCLPFQCQKCDGTPSREGLCRRGPKFRPAYSDMEGKRVPLDVRRYGETRHISQGGTG
jgi:hypothetical protein